MNSTNFAQVCAASFLICAATAAANGGGEVDSGVGKNAVAAPKTFAEKKIIAVQMKKISRQLDVKCEYCHTDAERGLKEGDFTLLTEEGSYAHETMFPLSKDFKVECSFCHAGGGDMTTAGERAHRDMKFIKTYKKTQHKQLNCLSCHVQGAKDSEFTTLTDLAKKLMPAE